MASDVTIHCRPHFPVALPPNCCYCLEPATTTYPVIVSLRKLRTGPYTKVSLSYPIQVPYCDAHGRDARLFGRFDQIATIVLVVAALALLVIIQLAAGDTLRSFGQVIWWCATVLMLALLAIGAAGIYAIGSSRLQRRYPALAGHYYTGSLGVKTEARVVQRAAQSTDAILAVTFTFSNDDFAARVAALHKTHVHTAQAS